MSGTGGAGAPHVVDTKTSPAQSGSSGAAMGTAAGARGPGVGIAQASESGRVNTEAAIERVKQLRAACSEWFANVNGGLTKGYDYERAVADQERIAQLFDAVSAEMRKKDLEHLFVDKKVTMASGEAVQLPKLPKNVVSKDKDVTSESMIAELKQMTTLLNAELEDLHAVADQASRKLAA